MKIGICSDLHLEFGPITINNPGNVEVLILSGDILVERDLDIFDQRQVDMGFMRKKAQSFHEFFQHVCKEFPKVIYIMGNHEHYHGDFKHTLTELRRKLAHYDNLHILERDILEVGDITFIGATLWTDMNKEDPITLHAMKRMMNDFRCVDNSNRMVSYKDIQWARTPDGSGDILRDANGNMVQESVTFRERPAVFCPEDAVEEHRKALGYIKTIVAERYDKKFVFCGHHTPSHFSCHPRYKDDQVMNGGYHSDLVEFILERPQIKLWTHGHTHELFDYMIGSTRVVCNPRGYDGYESLADRFELKVVEV